MSDDLISRQDAIDAMNGNISVTGMDNAKAVQEYIRSVSLKIHDLPSAQPTIDAVEVEHGEWEKTSINLSACSNCGNCVLTERTSGYFYCPNCGAKMNGEVKE